MDICQAKTYLNSFFDLEKNFSSINPAQFKLKRIDVLLEKFARPQKNFCVIHVAGSNGKGSVCAYTASILAAAGYKVGLYTSPHLVHLNERVRVITPNENFDDPFCGAISDFQLDTLIQETKSLIEEMRSETEFGRLTFFEVLTALALYHFSREKVDFVVLETGLGGRLDATNACLSNIAVLTHIGLEHKKFLGESINQIASEKAAIIKDAQQNVVIAPQTSEAMEVLDQRCRSFGIKPYNVGEDITIRTLESTLENQTIRLSTREFGDIDATTNLLGQHQAVNAATAVGIIEEMLDYLPLITSGIVKKGIEQTRWAGRFEVHQKEPLIILDGAHNPSSISALRDLAESELKHQKIVLILGVSKDKDIKAMMNDLQLIADEIIVTKADHPRALDPQDPVWERLSLEKPVRKTDTVKEALELAKSLVQKDGMILITGSLFIIGEVKQLCTNIKV